MYTKIVDVFSCSVMAGESFNIHASLRVLPLHQRYVLRPCPKGLVKKYRGGGGVGRSREGVGHEVLGLVQGVGRAIFSYP